MAHEARDESMKNKVQNRGTDDHLKTVCEGRHEKDEHIYYDHRKWERLISCTNHLEKCGR